MSISHANRVARDIVRFKSKVKARGKNACWLWTAGRNKDGYGKFAITVDGIYVTRPAHRQAWIFARGEIPGGMCVLHRCDNPPCVNLEHLFLGTAAENNHDRARKGRTWDQRGENNHRAKLSRGQVVKIRCTVKSGTPQRTVAKQFGISRALVSLIVNRKVWVLA